MRRRLQRIESDFRLHTDSALHVSREAFESLRNTLSKLAWLVVTQIIVVVGALITALILRITWQAWQTIAHD